MNGWLVFQLLFDLFLVILVLAFIIRGSRKNMPDTGELRELVDEFQSAVEKSQKVARELDEQLNARRDSLAAPAPNVERPLEKKAEPPKETETVSAAGAVSEYKQQVSELYRKGLPTEEISQKLSISLPVVKLIVAMLDNAERA